MEALKALAQTHPYWSLDEFAQVANAWLPRCLPEEKANTRVREEVNPRLIRQYATAGLLDAPGREGREARYTYHHLVQLLVIRRLLADGYATAVIHKLMAGQSDEALESMLNHGPGAATPESSMNPAIAFLQGLTNRTRSAFESPPAAEKARKAAPSPSYAPTPSKKKAAPPPPAAERPPALMAPAPMPHAASPAFDAGAAWEDRYEEEAEAVYKEAAPEILYSTYEPAAEPAASAYTPRRWVRVEVVPGLELSVLESFQFPHDPDERQALLSLIAQQLEAATQTP